MTSINLPPVFADSVMFGMTPQERHYSFAPVAGLASPKRQHIFKPKPGETTTRPGDAVHLYTGLKTEVPRRLGQVVCKEAEPLTILEDGRLQMNSPTHMQYLAKFGGKNEHTKDAIAEDEGFGDWRSLVRWIETEHGLPFTGLLITW